MQDAPNAPWCSLQSASLRGKSCDPSIWKSACGTGKAERGERKYHAEGGRRKSRPLLAHLRNAIDPCNCVIAARCVGIASTLLCSGNITPSSTTNFYTTHLPLTRGSARRSPVGGHSMPFIGTPFLMMFTDVGWFWLGQKHMDVHFLQSCALESWAGRSRP